MLKEFFTKNVAFKLTALVLSLVLWFIARYWLIK